MSQDSYRARRSSLLSRLEEGLVLVRGQGAGGMNASFLYLTGVDEPRGVLLLAPGGVRIEAGARYPGPDYVRGRVVQQLLFLPPSDPLAARWGEEGSATAERVRPEDVGVDAVLGTGELHAVLGRELRGSSVLHFVRGFEPSLIAASDPDAEFVARLRERFFGVTIRDASPVVHELRRSKDDGEVAAMLRAVDLTRAALEAALQKVAPGVNECEIEAEITRVYRSSGATHAFDPIVACGPRAVLPHYKSNSGPLERGALLLIDTGACLAGYRSDVTRTYPVDGRFDERQRHVYEAVLAAQREAIDRCRPGALLADVHEAAYRSIEAAGFGPAFIHGTSHHLGLDTHDVGDVHRPLVPGCVVTVEPGIYLSEEGIGVRIEDDVLVTAAEPRLLTAAIPSAVASIERRRT